MAPTWTTMRDAGGEASQPDRYARGRNSRNSGIPLTAENGNYPNNRLGMRIGQSYVSEIAISFNNGCRYLAFASLRAAFCPDPPADRPPD